MHQHRTSRRSALRNCADHPGCILFGTRQGADLFVPLWHLRRDASTVNTCSSVSGSTVSHLSVPCMSVSKPRSSLTGWSSTALLCSTQHLVAPRCCAQSGSATSPLLRGTSSCPRQRLGLPPRFRFYGFCLCCADPGAGLCIPRAARHDPNDDGDAAPGSHGLPDEPVCRSTPGEDMGCCCVWMVVLAPRGATCMAATC